MKRAFLEPKLQLRVRGKVKNDLRNAAASMHQQFSSSALILFWAVARLARHLGGGKALPSWLRMTSAVSALVRMRALVWALKD